MLRQFTAAPGMRRRGISLALILGDETMAVTQMLRFRELSLTSQLPFVAALCALCAALCLLWLAARSSAYLEAQRESLYGDALAMQIAAGLGDPLQRGDLLSARVSLQRFVDDTLAAQIEIRDVEGNPMGAAGSPAETTGSAYSAPIRIGKDIAGEVILSLDANQAKESRWRFLLSLLALAVALGLIVFMATRALSRRLTADLDQLTAALTLEPATAPVSANEIQRLQRAVEQLPLDMLRAQAAIPKAATNFAQGTLIFVHLASLVRYVDKLSEDKLHRYSRRFQQIVQAAASCYGGEISIARPFGLLIRFSPRSAKSSLSDESFLPAEGSLSAEGSLLADGSLSADGFQPADGSKALCAASCARLLAAVTVGLKEHTQLSFDVAMALGVYDEGLDRAEDFYPQLHLQGAVDELQEVCLAQETFPAILVSRSLREGALPGTDGEHSSDALAIYAPSQHKNTDNDAISEVLIRLNAESETLIEHQASLILERIKPNA